MWIVNCCTTANFDIQYATFSKILHHTVWYSTCLNNYDEWCQYFAVTKTYHEDSQCSNWHNLWIHVNSAVPIHTLRSQINGRPFGLRWFISQHELLVLLKETDNNLRSGDISWISMLSHATSITLSNFGGQKPTLSQAAVPPKRPMTESSLAAAWRLDRNCRTPRQRRPGRRWSNHHVEPWPWPETSPKRPQRQQWISHRSRWV